MLLVLGNLWGLFIGPDLIQGIPMGFMNYFTATSDATGDPTLVWSVNCDSVHASYLPGGGIHKWDLPVLHYHEITAIYPNPFLLVITQFFLR